MPRCLPWFSRNKNYVINKDGTKVRNTNSTDAPRIRKASDYDKIINTPSRPREKSVLPKRFQSHSSGNNLVENRSTINTSPIDPIYTATLDRHDSINSPSKINKTIIENVDISAPITRSTEEMNETNNAVQDVQTTYSDAQLVTAENANSIKDNLLYEDDQVQKLENDQVDFEDDNYLESKDHRCTIVEMKLQDDTCSFVSGDADLSIRGSEMHSVIDDGIVNINFDDEIPEISRRSGLRTDIIDIDKDIIKYEKKLEEIVLINEALLKNEFLKNMLTEMTRKLIVDIMTPLEVNKNEIVIQQGEPGDNMYVSELGHYQVIKDNEEVHTFHKSEVFGEVAVIYNHKRQATVKALTHGKLWKIHRDDYFRVMVTSAKEQESEIMSFLKTVPTIKNAPDSRLQQAVGLFTLKTYTANANIVTEGEEGNEFFIIKAGLVKVTKKSDVIAKLSRGKFFGEQALLNDDNKRQATVTPETPVVECLVLSVDYFKNLFADLEEFMTEPTFSESADVTVNNEYSNIQLEAIKLKTTLGVGGFGRVELAHLIKDDKKTFALKYLKRKRIVANEQIDHVFNEKQVQMRCSSPFIVQLYKTYNDRKYLYLLLELCLGGDIINLLQRQRFHCCKEEDTKFLAACVLEALSYLHDRKFVFRDLKPENMMLDSRGYVKLTDFGFAKKLEHGQRTYTFAGTPEYVAPEIIYQRGHDRAVDYWAFGIFIFELLVGKTPFKTLDTSYMETYNLIVRGIENVIFPSKIKNNASNLIKKLCNATPSERIGYKRQGIQEIREHRWFQGFNWEKLQTCRMTSPFIPKLSNHLDTKYFDKQRPDKDIPEDDFTAILNKF